MIKLENKTGWPLIKEYLLTLESLMISNKEKCTDLEKNISKIPSQHLIPFNKNQNAMMECFLWQDLIQH